MGLAIPAGGQGLLNRWRVDVVARGRQWWPTLYFGGCLSVAPGSSFAVAASSWFSARGILVLRFPMFARAGPPSQGPRAPGQQGQSGYAYYSHTCSKLLPGAIVKAGGRGVIVGFSSWQERPEGQLWAHGRAPTVGPDF